MKSDDIQIAFSRYRGTTIKERTRKGLYDSFSLLLFSRFFFSIFLEKEPPPPCFCCSLPPFYKHLSFRYLSSWSISPASPLPAGFLGDIHLYFPWFSPHSYPETRLLGVSLLFRLSYMYLLRKRLCREPLINAKVTISVILILSGVSWDICGKSGISVKKGIGSPNHSFAYSKVTRVYYLKWEIQCWWHT